MRTLFLHELSHWDTSGDIESYVMLEFVRLLKRRVYVQAFPRLGQDASVTSLYHESLYKHLPFGTLETIEETLRAKFRQAKAEREEERQMKVDAADAEALVYICQAEALAAQTTERL